MVLFWRHRKLKDMILATHGFLASSIGQIDADAQAFFDRVTTAGGSLSLTEKNAVNTLVIQMKTDGIWTKMKAIYPMVGASAAACAQNLKSSSFTGTFTATGWTFSSTGATPNGTSAFMNTGLNESLHLSQDDKHLSFYSRTQNSSLDAHDIGAESTGANFDLYLYYAAVTSKGYLDGVYPTNAAQVNNTNTLGFQIGSRTTNTSQKVYWNNSLIVTNTNTNLLQPQTNASIYIGATNRSGNALAYSNKQCAFASIGDGLSDTEASDFYTAVQAMQTTLSRNV
jgi:hypothetical protein